MYSVKSTFSQKRATLIAWQREGERDRGREGGRNGGREGGRERGKGIESIKEKDRREMVGGERK